MKVLLLSLVSCLVVLSSGASIGNEVEEIRTSEDLVGSVFECSSMYCVKDKLLNYLDTISGQERSFQENDDIDTTIFNRVSRLLQTQQFQMVLPGYTTLSYNPTTGLNIDMPSQPTDDQPTAEARGLLKKKLLLPVLLLLKLKMKALMPIFVALLGLKTMKALILSKLAILMVVGFIGYQMFLKNGATMQMMPAEPSSMYGVPETTTSTYQPSWEPSGGPYQRVWTPESANNIAYSAYLSSNSPSSSS